MKPHLDLLCFYGLKTLKIKKKVIPTDMCESICCSFYGSSYTKLNTELEAF